MDDTSPPRRGRPVDPYVDEALRTATFDILSRSGWRGATVERIAERAGVARTTIYRRHGSVHGVMLLLVAELFEDMSVPDTGSLHDDLVTWTRRLAVSWRDPRWVDLVCAIVAAQRESPDIADAVRARYRLRHEASRQIVVRAVERGELLSVDEGDTLLQLVTGLFHGPLTVSSEVISDDEIERVVGLLLSGFLDTSRPVGST